MKEKLLLFFIAMALTGLMYAPLVNAAPTVKVYAYTDKSQYKPGETGTLRFYIYNEGPEDMTPKNVTIEYPWYSPIWGGNSTIRITGVSLSKSQNYNNTDSFTIPTDGRANTEGKNIKIVAVYTWGTGVYSVTKWLPLSIASVPDYATFENMDRFMTLFTVLVVLVIVCTAIIAGTIFLAARRPKVTWKEPEKTS